MSIPKPSWLRVKSSASSGFDDTLRVIRKHNVKTICEEGNCPNIGECWQRRTAAFSIMGDTCTRNCAFCNVKCGLPEKLDQNEPKSLALAVKDLGLQYVVITSVDRDDLKDCGASHFASVVYTIKSMIPHIMVEILTPDFHGNEDYIKIVADSLPDVFAHNVDIVKSLHQKIKRPPATYELSLNVLKTIKKINPKMITKSSIMVGLGESKNDVIEALQDIRDAGVDIVTIGQYLPPSNAHARLVRYVTPDEFAQYEKLGLEMGFLNVFSGALVRSSYMADVLFANRRIT